jgi:hypothetical protein
MRATLQLSRGLHPRQRRGRGARGAGKLWASESESSGRAAKARGTGGGWLTRACGAGVRRRGHAAQDSCAGNPREAAAGGGRAGAGKRAGRRAGAGRAESRAGCKRSVTGAEGVGAYSRSTRRCAQACTQRQSTRALLPTHVRCFPSFRERSAGCSILSLPIDCPTMLAAPNADGMTRQTRCGLQKFGNPRRAIGYFCVHCQSLAVCNEPAMAPMLPCPLSNQVKEAMRRIPAGSLPLINNSVGFETLEDGHPQEFCKHGPIELLELYWNAINV